MFKDSSSSSYIIKEELSLYYKGESSLGFLKHVDGQCDALYLQLWNTLSVLCTVSILMEHMVSVVHYIYSYGTHGQCSVLDV